MTILGDLAVRLKAEEGHVADLHFPYDGHELGRELVAEGLLPANCMDVTLFIPVNGGLALRYEVMVTDVELAKIARAMERLLSVQREK